MDSKRRFISINQILCSTLLIYLLVLHLTTPAAANQLSQTDSEAVVHTVLFYSPSCGHCHKVIEEDLPPIVKKYGAKLDIIIINVATPEGRQLFQSAAEYFKNVRDIRGVPTMIVGEQVLVGSLEIPELLPGIIDMGLAKGGIAFPVFPGLSEVLQAQQQTQPVDNPKPAIEITEEPLPITEASNQSLPAAAPPSTDYHPFIQKFLQDPFGNAVAVITLIGMLISVVVVGYFFLRPPDESSDQAFPRWLSWPNWVIPIICIAGFGVAGYMSYVEITHTEAICGPLGDCNSVQQSPYATLWGFLPVGVLGIIGYVSIGIVWLIHRYSSYGLRKVLSLSMWGMALLGTLFSIYLTFLEPFIIGATCAWCISSAILITLLLLATTEPALNAIAVEEQSAIVEV